MAELERVRISLQPGKARKVRIQLWGLGYKYGMQRLRCHLLRHLCTDLKSLYLDSIGASRAIFYFIDFLGQDVMSNAFLPSTRNPWRLLLSFYFDFSILSCNYSSLCELSHFILDWAFVLPAPFLASISILVIELMFFCEGRGPYLN